MVVEIDFTKYEDLISHNPASVEETQSIESMLDVAFADDYRLYLCKYGFATVNGHELTGVSSSQRRNVVSVTEKERAYDHGVDPRLYVIERTGVDGGVAWQSPEGEVVVRYPNGVSSAVANSLMEYIEL